MAWARLITLRIVNGNAKKRVLSIEKGQSGAPEGDLQKWKMNHINDGKNLTFQSLPSQVRQSEKFNEESRTPSVSSLKTYLVWRIRNRHSENIRISSKTILITIERGSFWLPPLSLTMIIMTHTTYLVSSFLNRGFI